MKGFRILSRNIRDSFKSVFRNFSLSMASIMCITITLIVVSFAILLAYNVNNFTLEVEKDVTIVAFLDSNVKQEEIDNIKDELLKINNIYTPTFQSKEDIKKEMMESSQLWNEIMGGWTEEENPLQDTFSIKVMDIRYVEEVADSIKKIDKVASVSYGEGLIKPLISVFDAIKNIGVIAVVALVLVTAFLISNTIKITIFSRKREIEIMRLVGASNINIKLPFMFEGLLLGLLGAIVPIILTCYGYIKLYENANFTSISPFIVLVKPTPFVYIVSLILIVIGMIVGMFGSWRAVKKHLKI